MPLCQENQPLSPSSCSLVQSTLQEAGFLPPLLKTISENSGGPCAILECNINKRVRQRRGTQAHVKTKGIKGSNNKLATAKGLKERANESWEHTWHLVKLQDRREWATGTENWEAKKPAQRQTIKFNKHLLIEPPGSTYNYYEVGEKGLPTVLLAIFL